jgi:hypothetical protein
MWVLSAPYPLRFLFASRPAVMGEVLGIVYRCIATHLVRKAGFTREMASTGAVTLIQRFGSALNFNIHFHMLFLDGVYVECGDGALRFRWVEGPTSVESSRLAHPSHCASAGPWSGRDCWNANPRTAICLECGRMDQLLGHSITYRIAVGAQHGRKVLTLQTLPACGQRPMGHCIGAAAIGHVTTEQDPAAAQLSAQGIISHIEHADPDMLLVSGQRATAGW